jgi:hypothetical protein
MNEQSRAWHADNKERVTANKRAYVAKHRKETNAYQRQWAVEHKESRDLTNAKRKEADKLLRREHFLKYRSRYIWNNIRKRAEATGRPFAMTREMIADMLADAEVCPVLGIPMTYAEGRAHDASPSFDCFDPVLGYVPGNVHVISRRANMIKHNATIEEVRMVLTWMEATTVVIDALKE